MSFVKNRLDEHAGSLEGHRQPDDGDAPALRAGSSSASTPGRATRASGASCSRTSAGGGSRRRLRDGGHPHLPRRRRTGGRRRHPDPWRPNSSAVRSPRSVWARAPAASCPEPTPSTRRPRPAIVDLLRRSNPWVRDADFDHHGYGLVTAGAEIFQLHPAPGGHDQERSRQGVARQPLHLQAGARRAEPARLIVGLLEPADSFGRRILAAGDSDAARQTGDLPAAWRELTGACHRQRGGRLRRRAACPRGCEPRGAGRRDRGAARRQRRRQDDGAAGLHRPAAAPPRRGAGAGRSRSTGSGSTASAPPRSSGPGSRR